MGWSQVGYANKKMTLVEVWSVSRVFGVVLGNKGTAF